jgi:hypothetical protein
MTQGGEADPFELKRMMRQEAHEKAFEIQVMSQRLYEQEKYKLVQAGLKTCNETHEQMLTNMTQKLNIAVSQSISEARLNKMKERNECVLKIRVESRAKLIAKYVNPSNSTYRETIRNLIIQVISYSLLSNKYLHLLLLFRA